MSRNKFVDQNQSLLFDFDENISNDGFMQCTAQTKILRKPIFSFGYFYHILMCYFLRLDSGSSRFDLIS